MNVWSLVLCGIGFYVFRWLRCYFLRDFIVLWVSWVVLVGVLLMWMLMVLRVFFLVVVVFEDLDMMVLVWFIVLFLGVVNLVI